MHIQFVRLGRWMGLLSGSILLILAGLVAYAMYSYNRTYQVPLLPTRASSDSALIRRGYYLVNGPGHCADCHAPDSSRLRMFKGEIVPLSGGAGENTFLGSWNAPNLTSDSATGIGGVSDELLARMFRHGINREGRIALPFTDAFADLAEEDLVAILSYLRTLPPLKGAAPEKHINILGKLTLAYFMRPYSPKTNPPAKLRPEPSIEYGRYLAKTVSRCQSCHTPRNLKTGEFLGPPFSGGLSFRSRNHPGFVYVSPNLTPDSTSGRIAAWSEEAFLSRFRAGLVIPDSPMPWGSFMRMSDDDLRALYRYLRSLEPAFRENGPAFQPQNGPAAG